MKAKIVIIEDEPELRNTILDLLEISGYQVEATANGKEGCELILKDLPDLVICDVNMPKMNGYEVLSALNSRMEESLLPAFLFLTARVQLDDIKQGLKLGADDYITKPFITTELLDTIEMRLNKRKKLMEYRQDEEVIKHEHSSVPYMEKTSSKKIAIPFDLGIRYIDSSEITKCEAERAYCNFYLANGEKILVSKSMKEFQDILEAHGFLRVHKSYMVNLNHVEKYIRGKGGYLVLKDGSHVDVSVRKKEDVISALNC